MKKNNWLEVNIAVERDKYTHQFVTLFKAYPKLENKISHHEHGMSLYIPWCDELPAKGDQVALGLYPLLVKGRRWHSDNEVYGIATLYLEFAPDEDLVVFFEEEFPEGTCFGYLDLGGSLLVNSM